MNPPEQNPIIAFPDELGAAAVNPASEHDEEHEVLESVDEIRQAIDEHERGESLDAHQALEALHIQLGLPPQRRKQTI